MDGILGLCELVPTAGELVLLKGVESCSGDVFVELGSDDTVLSVPSSGPCKDFKRDPGLACSSLVSSSAGCMGPITSLLVLKTMRNLQVSQV